MTTRTFLLLIAIGLPAFAIAAYGAREALTTPRAERDWVPGLDRTARFELAGDGAFRLVNFRNWGVEKEPGPGAWTTHLVDPSQTVALWYFVDSFGKWAGVAHTFLVFELATPAGPDFISVSVEARRQRGQSYSALKGAFRSYELAYVWSSERDALIRRAVVAGEPVYGYRLNVDADTAAAVLAAFMAETNELADRPRFYNTLTTNCTSALARTVNGMGRGTVIPWHYSYIVTGYADRYLHRLGYLGVPESDLATLRQDAFMSDRIRDLVDADPDRFSTLLRAAP